MRMGLVRQIPTAQELDCQIIHLLWKDHHHRTHWGLEHQTELLEREIQRGLLKKERQMYLVQG
jgi:hypothetical protein